MDKNWSLDLGYSKEKMILCRTNKIIKEKFDYNLPIWPNLEQTSMYHIYEKTGQWDKGYN